MGSAIHQSEGFYFRHDSQKNPQFDVNLLFYQKNKGNDVKISSAKVVEGRDLLQ